MPDTSEPDILDKLKTTIPPWEIKTEADREKLREMARIMLQGQRHKDK